MVMREGEHLDHNWFSKYNLTLLRWMWLNSVTDVEFTSWASGQPNNNQTVTTNYEDCAKMDKENRYQWMSMRFEFWTI